jgi:hypothetical protein
MLKHLAAESTYARGFIIDSIAIIAGHHAGLSPAGTENIRAKFRCLRNARIITQLSREEQIRERRKRPPCRVRLGRTIKVV